MKILIVDDERSIRNATSLAIRAEGHEADTADSGRIALLKLREEIYDLVFLDMRLGDEDGLVILREIRTALPHLPVVVFTAFASIETAVAAMQAGASDYLGKPFTPEQLRLIISRVSKSSTLERRIENLEGAMAGSSPGADFESDDPRVAHVYDVLFRAARSPASLLILGESGTGKSLVARAVHDRSHLTDGPFVTVSCPSLSRELLESELFGHLRGSFTGAVKDTWGKVAAARGGTLFLDEIGELPLEIQPKLLRLLQDREYERVGENKTHTADVRVIAATNRDLSAAVAAGTFREDLYYRLNVISVTMPPLRQRPSDLLRLADHFLTFFARQVGNQVDGFDDESRKRLLSHPWPGNVRELRNVIERAVILARGGKLRTTDLFETGTAAAPAAPGLHVGALVSIEQIERSHIERVLEIADSQESAARILGIDPATLYRKRKKWERSGHA
jgi:NtrC-family two-component system response regulator AlgB